MPTSEQIEKAAFAIMIEDECGLTVDGKRVLCDDAVCGKHAEVKCVCRNQARAALSAAEEGKPRVMMPVPAEMSLELMKSINFENQVLAYEKGSYFNAWMVFDEYEGGWSWMNESDNEPRPSHYCPLPRLSALQEGE